MERQPLTKNLAVQDFLDFYWLKNEMSRFLKFLNLSASGSMADLKKRIVNYLRTGIIPTVKKGKKIPQIRLKGPFSLKTIIPPNMILSDEIREFFISQCGPRFRYKIDIIKYIRENPGKSFGDVAAQWERVLSEERERKKIKKKIAPSCEYNRYIRDFMAQTSKKSLKEAIICWKYKKAQRGNNWFNKKGKLGGQNKMPRLSNERKYVEEILSINKNI